MTEFNKENPFPAKIVERELLNKAGSTKETYHIRLDLTGSKIAYKAGDALAIFPENPAADVDALLAALGKSGSEVVTDPRSGAEMSLKHFIKTKVNLLRLPSPLLKRLNSPELPHESDLVSLFSACKAVLPIQEVISYFAPMLPRFYSIASSPLVSPNHIDLLVACFTYTHGNKVRKGLGSDYLCNVTTLHETAIYSYLQSTPHFTLPDPKAPILMIGPGTGVAPYRAFLEERDHSNAPGDNWLFFGECHRSTDFYYEPFFEALVKKMRLRLDLAFSRDQEEKVYVQQRLLDNASDVWGLINSNGTLYICGDAKRMAKDVTHVLHSIAETEGKLSSADAKAFFKGMRKEKRLLIDVY